MRNALTAVLLFSSLYLSPAFSSDVITIDPNVANAAAQAEPADPSDSGLQQPVTYQAKQKRLHTVVDELAEMTGVAIRCGANSRDWQTRDLPVTVFAKEMPLGRLLRLLADCTHLELKAERYDDKQVFRFLTSPTTDEQYVRFDETNETNKRARISRCWDVSASLAQYPENAFNTPDDEKERLRLDFARKISKVIAQLGPEGKDRLMAGDAVLVSMADPEASKEVGEVLRMLWENQNWDLGFTPGFVSGGKPDWSDPSQCCIKFQRSNIDVDVMFGFPYRRDSASSSDYYCPRTILDPTVQKYCAPEYISGYKPLPEQKLNHLPQIEEKRLDESRITCKQYDQEPMKIELDLSQYADQDFPRFADMAAEIAEASGWNLVCEDFLSHKMNACLPEVMKTGITMKQVLEGLYNIHWYLAPQTRTICGIDWQWRERHRNLVQEKLLVDLQEKLEGRGVGFIDALPLAFLTQDQYYDWISYSPKLAALAQFDFSPHKGLWQIFASLDREDRELATSDMGLPLRKIYSPQLLDAINKGNRDSFRRCSSLRSGMQYQLPTDPNELADLIIRVHKEERMYKHEVELGFNGLSRSHGTGGTEEQGYKMKTCYSMEISGRRNGQPFNLTFNGPSGFPVFSLQWKRASENDTKLVGTVVK